MNANELADEIEKGYDGFRRDLIVTLLRQQQAEIEALKAAKIRAYNNGVEDGRKPNTNNEPVAWMSKKGILSYVNDMGFTIPLYTHPVKELTDEEILECWNETHPAVVCLNAELPLFARAILKRAQEK